MVNADDKSQESNDDRNAANRESAGNYSVQLGQTRIDRSLKKTKLYSADSLKEELAQSAMAKADSGGNKQEGQRVQPTGELKAIGTAEDISNQVRQARTNRQLKKTLLYSSENVRNSTSGNPGGAASNAAIPPTAIPPTAIPNAAIPHPVNPHPVNPNPVHPNPVNPNANAGYPNPASTNPQFPISANPNTPFPNTPFPETPFPNIPVSNIPVSNTPVSNTPPPLSRQEGQYAKVSEFSNDVESEIFEPTKIQAKPRQQARSRSGTSPADLEREELGSNESNRRESFQDFQPEAPNKQGLVVSLTVLVLLLVVGAFVFTSQFLSKGNAPHHKVRSLAKPAGPMYYTGLQVSFNPDQVPMTVDNMQEYNSTKISDEVSLFVASVLPNSPAGKVKMQLGSRVVSIDGESINGLTIQEVHSMLEGESNSTVKISVMNGLQPQQTFSLLRLIPVDPTAVGKGKNK